ncbi:PLAT/LH2 domain-containing protein [Brevibacillus laterosporus]|uniref:PLAT/LH2 domain-containing protein n=1 Tax=Brevibacillus laterosporus TaxID=1465 RepID=UPI003D204D56
MKKFAPLLAAVAVLLSVAPASSFAAHQVSAVQKAQKNYTLEIKTSESTDAGTDSNIKVTIRGSKGSFTKEINGTFEQGDLETFYLSGTDVGEIRSLTLISDGKGWKSDWKVEYVILNGLKKTVNAWVSLDGKAGSLDIPLSNK